ncbi:MAG: methyltransferase [Myxococcota bacterium]|nr:methyltransferase [Myxococcota bacterium]
MSVLRRRIARPILNGLRRPYVLGRIARPSEVGLLGHRLRTDPDVFHPVHFSSSRILAEQLLERPLRGLHILDMGTGAGPVALAVASAGALVTACDLNPRAVALARENSTLNGLNIEVLESDLFSALSGRRFDLVCFNLPFYARDPVTLFEAAYNAGRNLETVHRFASGCARHLTTNGRVVVLFSEDCGPDRMVRTFAESGFSLESSRVTRSLLEDFHVTWFVNAR